MFGYLIREDRNNNLNKFFFWNEGKALPSLISLCISTHGISMDERHVLYIATIGDVLYNDKQIDI